MQSLGRGLQLIGLVALPAAMMLQFANSVRLWTMLTLTVAGLCAFYIGRIVEGYSAPKS
ncbi:MAG: hypothetical protein N2C14_08005 [Planctomycetales bacterium]